MAPKKTVPAVPLFEVRRSGIQGRGGFATRRIKKGERVGEYVGERITQAEGDRRYDDDAMARHHTFLFSVTARTVIDAAVGGNGTRFINHSCTPNCDAVIEGGRVFIDACKSIPEGAELFYDYSYEREADAGPNVEEQYPCYCGTPKCRGTILMPVPPRRKRRSKSRVTQARRTTSRDVSQARSRGASRTTSRTASRQTSPSTRSASKTSRTTRTATRR
jgi:uncharacterized protein